MACGNNKVGRTYLATQPVASAEQGQRLFNETRRARDEPIMLVDGRGENRLVQERYSNTRKDGTIEYFLDENRNEALNPNLHIHVIHEERHDRVHLHITDRRGGVRAEHLHAVNISNPDGRKVNAAEERLADILRQMNSDSE